MTREHQTEPAVGKVRVTGAATVVAPCDLVSFVVTLRAPGTSLRKAHDALRRRLARFDKVLIAHASAVSGAQHQPTLHHGADADMTAERRIQVTGPNGAGLSGLLYDIRKIDGAGIGEFTWSLSAGNGVYAFVRRAATDDAIAAAHSHARALKATVVGLEWLASDEAPARLDDNDVNAVVRSEVLIQVSIGAADLSEG